MKISLLLIFISIPCYSSTFLSCLKNKFVSSINILEEHFFLSQIKSYLNHQNIEQNQARFKSIYFENKKIVIEDQKGRLLIITFSENPRIVKLKDLNNNHLYLTPMQWNEIEKVFLNQQILIETPFLTKSQVQNKIIKKHLSQTISEIYDPRFHPAIFNILSNSKTKKTIEQIQELKNLTPQEYKSMIQEVLLQQGKSSITNYAFQVFFYAFLIEKLSAIINSVSLDNYLETHYKSLDTDVSKNILFINASSTENFLHLVAAKEYLLLQKKYPQHLFTFINAPTIELLNSKVNHHAAQKKFDKIFFFAHGTPGEMHLNNELLNNKSLSKLNLKNVGSPNADLILTSCQLIDNKLVKNRVGEDFVVEMGNKFLQQGGHVYAANQSIRGEIKPLLYFRTKKELKTHDAYQDWLSLEQQILKDFEKQNSFDNMTFETDPIYKTLKSPLTGPVKFLESLFELSESGKDKIEKIEIPPQIQN